MKGRVWLFLDRLRASYWFVPAVMLTGSAALALGLIALDQRVGARSLRRFWWIFSGGPEGARSLLGTVAGSVIGVAGTTFSITMAVLSQTSSQFGPRLLRGFLRDVANQAVLGVFVGTFLYSLLVLRVVRSVEEVAFIPHIAVTGSVVLALLSVGALVFFIHHVSTSIQASHIIASVARELERTLARQFPQPLNRPDAPDMPANEDGGYPIHARQSGYVQAIETGALQTLAQENSVRLHLRYAPGQWVTRGTPLVIVVGSQSSLPGAGDALAKQVNRAFSLGDQRTPAQDTEFLLLQLVEIAVRALSPGINDPVTARMCLDRLGAALCYLCSRQFPDAQRRDARGVVRIVLVPLRFSKVADAAFGAIRHYGSSDPDVALHLLRVIGIVANCAPAGERREYLWDHLRLTRDAALTQADAAYHAAVEEAYRACKEASEPAHALTV